jgi:hypothetical protein
LEGIRRQLPEEHHMHQHERRVLDRARHVNAMRRDRGGPSCAPLQQDAESPEGLFCGGERAGIGRRVDERRRELQLREAGGMQPAGRASRLIASGPWPRECIQREGGGGLLRGGGPQPRLYPVHTRVEREASVVWTRDEHREPLEGAGEVQERSANNQLRGSHPSGNLQAANRRGENGDGGVALEQDPNGGDELRRDDPLQTGDRDRLRGDALAVASRVGVAVTQVQLSLHP